MSAGADRRIRWTTTGCVGVAGADRWDRLLPAHAHAGCAAQPARVGCGVDSLSVDGMIVAASTTLLADSRSGHKGAAMPWALLVAGSVASLAANVAVAEPTVIGRVIAAWPILAPTASYEMFTRQVRRSAASVHPDGKVPHSTAASPGRQQDGHGPVTAVTLVGAGSRPARPGRRLSGQDPQRQAWQ